MNDQEQQLEAILRGRGLAWAVDMFAPTSEAAAHYLKSLKDLEKYIEQRRLGKISFFPDTLPQLLCISPYKADAFLQALVSIRSTPMLCVAWRILQGMQIAAIDMEYLQLSTFTLRVVLRSPYNQDEEYQSDDINDAVFLRHLGKSMVDDKPFFDGFYALRQR